MTNPLHLFLGIVASLVVASAINLLYPRSTPMSSQTTNIIPIVALGVYREVAAKMDSLFAPTPFRMTAILDLKQDPPSVRYSPENLLTVLYNLHPRPKVFITGAALSRAMTAESIAVWEGYVKESRL
ncbi:hypothetical protein G7Y79_00011g031410 [Physcia stellaris]|nr:hypothetical protein G7Y79_00011g031410 [Physcia stellaris]